MKLIYDVEDKMSFGKMVVFAIQQLLAIMAATLVVPMIVGHGMKSEAALFGAGVGTLVYIAFTKKKSPVFLGSSFAFLCHREKSVLPSYLILGSSLSISLRLFNIGFCLSGVLMILTITLSFLLTTSRVYHNSPALSITLRKV